MLLKDFVFLFLLGPKTGEFITCISWCRDSKVSPTTLLPENSFVFLLTRTTVSLTTLALASGCPCQTRRARPKLQQCSQVSVPPSRGRRPMSNVCLVTVKSHPNSIRKNDVAVWLADKLLLSGMPPRRVGRAWNPVLVFRFFFFWCLVGEWNVWSPCQHYMPNYHTELAERSHWPNSIEAWPSCAKLHFLFEAKRKKNRHATHKVSIVVLKPLTEARWGCMGEGFWDVFGTCFSRWSRISCPKWEQMGGEGCPIVWTHNTDNIVVLVGAFEVILKTTTASVRTHWNHCCCTLSNIRSRRQYILGGQGLLGFKRTLLAGPNRNPFFRASFWRLCWSLVLLTVVTVAFAWPVPAISSWFMIPLARPFETVLNARKHESLGVMSMPFSGAPIVYRGLISFSNWTIGWFCACGEWGRCLSSCLDMLGIEGESCEWYPDARFVTSWWTSVWIWFVWNMIWSRPTKRKRFLMNECT